MKEQIYFEQIGLSATGKTKIVNVMKNGTRFTLGQIKWSSNWKKYTFQPYENIIFDDTCLKEVIDELERLNKE